MNEGVSAGPAAVGPRRRVTRTARLFLACSCFKLVIKFPVDTSFLSLTVSHH